MNINDFLTAWLELDADPLAVARRLSLTIEQLARNLQTADVRELLDIVDDLRRRQREFAAHANRITAGEHLRKSLAESPNPIERRRAATTLARLAHQMLHASPSSPAAGGGGGRGSARPEGERRAHPTSTTSPTPPPPGGRGPEGGFECPPITTLPNTQHSPKASTARTNPRRPSPATLLAAAGAP